MSVGQGAAVVAVVGRPNVGKSTLVNRLAGRREAIVEERPGVTRDRTAHDAEWRGRHLSVIDSGGWTPGWSEDGDPLAAAVTAQAELAAETADVVLFVVDAAVGRGGHGRRPLAAQGGRAGHRRREQSRCGRRRTGDGRRCRLRAGSGRR